MRIGLIADIHGNLVALDAVLRALESESLDRIVCLGDVAVLGPQPSDVLDRLRQLGCPVVLGNTDAWILDGGPAYSPSAEILAWCRVQLGPADLDFVRGFQPTVDVALGDSSTLLACHGSPRSFNDVISATTSEELLEPMLGESNHRFIVGGHTHVQLVRRLGERYFINPGSVGLPGVGPGTPDLPVNQGVRWAEFAIVDADDDRHAIELRRMPLDLAEVIAAARSSGMPGLEWWLTLWASSE
jgi:putative phosphoesterase